MIPDVLTYREKLAFLLDDRTPEERSKAAYKAWESRARAKEKEQAEPREKRSRHPIGEMRLADPKTDAARLKALVIPPGWRDVHISDDPDARVLVVAKDSKGRTVYRRSAKYTEAKAAEKFQRIKDFHKVLPELRQNIVNDLKRGADVTPEDREAAAVMYLIDKTAFRPGSDEDTGADVKAHGATTLEADHVKIVGNSVHFSFVGKKGVAITKTVDDARLAALLKPRLAKGGRLFDTSDDRLRDYVKSRSGGPFKPKDFRTWHGTTLAMKMVKSMPSPKTRTQFNRQQREVAKVVASFLGNTPAVAKSSYIDPSVWSKWEGRIK